MYKRFPALEQAIKFVKNEFWNIEDDKLKLRKTLFIIRDIRKELNPEHRDHIALLIDLISLFSIAINRVTLAVFNQYLLPESKENLSRELKIWIWGGMDQYQYWNKLYRVAMQKGSEEDIEIELPEWDTFVQLIRQFLEEPFETSRVPLLLREVAFEFLSERKYSDFSFSKQLAKDNPQDAKFALMTCSYVCKAAILPREFDEIITKRLIELQSF